MDKSIKKGKFEEQEKGATLGRITPTDQYEPLRDADLVVEAVLEEVAVKKQVFLELDEVCRPGCVFATNTSSLPITRLASFLGPERRAGFIGAHFFSPASVMQLVEVIPGVETAEATVAFMMECCRGI
ncbi:MAG: 3-hydroxyacyl-CoA dehydrogenase NAD-binding domain-containing protein, partial [Thermodesulfobacteriota bacterium]